jgi:type II secretory pathway component PulF
LLVCAAVIVILYYLGWIRWEPWLVRRLWRRIHTAWVLRYLAFTVTQGRPLEQGVRLLSANYPATYIAQRLYAATGMLAAGQHWCDALLAQGLIRAGDARVLRAAERAGNLPWAMEEISESNLRRMALRFRALLSLVFPVLILLCGAALLTIIVSLFLPFPQIFETVR